ncbi:MAG: histidine phosphatase family protein [Prosthecobacter sp.]|nr:histidine phosphatase family protein [Prosthecobacter sp.]
MAAILNRIMDALKRHACARNAFIMALTRIFLIRHGATTLTAEDRFAGSTDVPLSDTGREQARRLAQRLSTLAVAAVYASPLGRTMETARLLAEPHALEVQPRDGLREISHGQWEQLTRQDVERRFPAEAAAWEEDPYTFAPLGGESGLAVTARALPALLEIVRQHEGRAVIVVSHKATIRLLLSSLLGFDPRRYRDNLDQHPAALNIVDFKDPVRARLMLFNDTSHISDVVLAKPEAPKPSLSSWWTH